MVAPAPHGAGQRPPRPRRWDSPTHCRRGVLECAYIASRVPVAVDDQATLFAAKGAVGQAQIIVHPATAGARLRGWLPATDDEHLAAIPRGFVGQLPPERTEADIADGLRETVVVHEHAGHVQVFQHHDGRGFRQSAGEVLHRVGALTRDTRHGGAVVRACARPSGDSGCLCCVRETARCKRLSCFSRRRSGLGLGMTVPSERVASVLTPRSPPTTGPRFIGALCSCATATSSATDQCPACSLTVAESRGSRGSRGSGRQIAPLFEPQPPQARQLNGVGEDADRAGEAGAA
jgi:hypothetical protein